MATTLPIANQQPTQRKNTVYRVHVEGQPRGLVADTYQKTYETDQRPSSPEIARQLAEDDFLRVTKIHAEEVTTIKTLLF